LDPDEKRVGVFSIPRDTRVHVPGIGFTKVNHAFAHGGGKLLKQTVSEFLSIPVNYILQVNLGSVRRIVDKIGGVKLDVKSDMYYQDQAGGLHIDIKKGEQELSGEDIIQYLRFRQDRNGDIGRIERQQTFVTAVAEKLTDVGKIFELPGIIRSLVRSVSTDLSTREMVNLALQFSEAYKDGSVDKGTVPGAITMIKGVSYWRPDIVLMDKALRRVVFGFNGKRKIVSRVGTVDEVSSKEPRRMLNIKEVTRITEQSEPDESEIANVKGLIVEVLNGFGRPFAAQEGARFFKRFGIRVSNYGNAGTFSYDETLVVDWKGKVDASLAVAALLKIDPSKIIVYDKPGKPIDITVVLGEDWETLQKELP
jgi:LCP family protein required for cell wall assembly